MNLWHMYEYPSKIDKIKMLFYMSSLPDIRKTRTDPYWHIKHNIEASIYMRTKQATNALKWLFEWLIFLSNKMLRLSIKHIWLAMYHFFQNTENSRYSYTHFHTKWWGDRTCNTVLMNDKKRCQQIVNNYLRCVVLVPCQRTHNYTHLDYDAKIIQHNDG